MYMIFMSSSCRLVSSMKITFELFFMAEKTCDGLEGLELCRIIVVMKMHRTIGFFFNVNFKVEFIQFVAFSGFLSGSSSF